MKEIKKKEYIKVLFNNKVKELGLIGLFLLGIGIFIGFIWLSIKTYLYSEILYYCGTFIILLFIINIITMMIDYRAYVRFKTGEHILVIFGTGAIMLFMVMMTSAIMTASDDYDPCNVPTILSSTEGCDIIISENISYVNEYYTGNSSYEDLNKSERILLWKDFCEMKRPKDSVKKVTDYTGAGTIWCHYNTGYNTGYDLLQVEDYIRGRLIK